MSDASSSSIEIPRKFSNISLKGNNDRKYSQLNVRPNPQKSLTSKVFENEQEELLFKTINLIRNKPEWAI